MTDATNSPFNTDDLEHVGQFRLAAAGIVRNLLSAVVQVRPELLPDPSRKEWWNDHNKPSNRPIEILLRHSAAKLREFGNDFAGYVNSVPAIVDQVQPSIDEHVERLRELILMFADPDELEQAARQFRNRTSVAWDNLCTWESLPDIRRHLDALELPKGRDLSPKPPKIEDLVAEPPKVIRYLRVEIKGATPKTWKLLKYLLQCRFNTADVLDLVEQGKVWEDDADNEWGRVDSLLKVTNKFFSDNEIPFNVSRSRELRQVFLRRIEQNEEPSVNAQVKRGTKSSVSKPRKAAE